MKTAEKLGLEAAVFLEESFGVLCELALDLAIDREGRIYVLEVNPTPAREVFARSGDSSTYRKALVRPMEYALWLYNNKGAPLDVVYKNPVAFTESAGTKVGMQVRAAVSDIGL